MEVIKLQESIDRMLVLYSLGEQPEELYRPMEYILELDQRRLYSLLTLWGCYLFAGDVIKALRPALGVEIFHGFFMVHEDLLDGVSSRGKHETVHSKWSNDVAILSGDAMIFKAYELMIQVDPHLIKPVVKMFNQCFTKICESKQLALNQSNSSDVNVSAPLSGALAGFCLKLGSSIAGASQDQIIKAEQVGIGLGPTFGAGPTADLARLAMLDCENERKQRFEKWLLSC